MVTFDRNITNSVDRAGHAIDRTANEADEFTHSFDSTGKDLVKMLTILMWINVCISCALGIVIILLIFLNCGKRKY